MLVAFAISCSLNSVVELTPGGIYSIDRGDGTFGIVKLLVLEDGVAHVRIYKNWFEQRPQTIELDDLSLGGIDDPDGFGIGHIPIPEKDFSSWQPELLTITMVEEEELEGYDIWKESGGGVFGP